jgi:hypothetical protein
MIGLESLNKKSMNNLTDDYYMKKYLKYKQKYIELKQHGGLYDNVEQLTTRIQALETLKENVINETNTKIESFVNDDPPKFRTHIARKNLPVQCDDTCMYKSLEENELIRVDGKSYDIFDPKQRMTPVNYNLFKKLLDNMDYYNISTKSQYSNLGQVFRGILNYKDKQGAQQNERYQIYEDVVKKIINSVKPETLKKLDTGFNTK